MGCPVIRGADQHYWIGPRIVELAALAPAATTFSGDDDGVAMTATGISTRTTAAHAWAADRGDRTTPQEPGRQ